MLTFDPVKHEYRDGDRVIPSVTQILAPLSDFSFVDADVLSAAQEFGTAVHRACELYDLQQLDIDALDPELRPYLDGWIKFCHDHSCQWVAIEKRVYCETMGYAGTLDRVGFVGLDSAVVDIKSGSAMFPSVGPQLAAYAHAYSAIARSMKRYAVRLFPGSYELKQYTSPTDLSVFMSLITLRSFCERHSITLNFKEKQSV